MMSLLTEVISDLQITTHNNCEAKETIVLLHGWGYGEDCWGQLLPELNKKFTVITVALPGYEGNQYFPLDAELFFSELVKKIPKKAWLMGWSLGGLLATELAYRYSNYFKGLITLATNPCFIGKDNWPGMQYEVFSDFENLTKKDTAKALPYFSSLESKGERQEKKMLKELRSHIKKGKETNVDVLLKGLLWLKNKDAREFLSNLTIPSLHIFSVNDALVPVSVAEKIKPLNHQAEVFILPEHGHRFFYLGSESLVKNIGQWLETHLGFTSSDKHAKKIDQGAMIRSFNKAANSYDEAAHLQKEIADKLLVDIKNKSNGLVKSIVDVGCGTGYLTKHLHDTFSDSIVLGVDISKSMVAYAIDKHESQCKENKLIFLQGSAEKLPINDASIDLMTGNFSLQWCEELSVALVETKRILKKEGKAFFTIPIEGTFTELSQAWARVDGYKHVNDFIKKQELLDRLKNIYGKKFSLSIEDHTEYYDSYFSLAKELKALGVTNVNQQRPHGLTGSSSLKKVINAYEVFRNKEGLLPVSWVIATIEITGY